MIRVKDEQGKIIEGLYKTSVGSLVVKPEAEYKKYRQQQEVINRLTSKIDDVSSTVEQLKELIMTLTQDKNRK